MIAARHALAGKADNAREAMLALRQLDPALRVSMIAGWFPFHRAVDVSRYATGLKAAGLPD